MNRNRFRPYHHDACNHDWPRDRFLGTVEVSNKLLPGQTTKYDVYVYQDNALTAPIPDMNVCLRHGSEGSQYASPGNAEEFVKRFRTTQPTEFPSGRVVEWPLYYVLAANLIEEWIEGGKQ